MKWLVTGGTGLIGSALVEAVRARGDEAIVLTRRPRKDGEIAWTPERAGAWTEQVVEADVVVHLAGAGVMDRPWTAARLAELRASRIEPARILAETIASKDAARRPRVLVSASAIGIYGMRRDDALLDEDAAPADDELARLCVDWEAAADPARDAGVRVVHPRIGLVLGKGGLLEKMVPAFRAFVGGPLGDGTQWQSWVHIEDVVRALLFAVDDARLPPGPFNVVAPNPVRMNELARTLGRVLGRPSAMRVPALALRATLGKDRAEVVLSGQRVVPRRLEQAGFVFRHPTLEAALADVLG